MKYGKFFLLDMFIYTTLCVMHFSQLFQCFFFLKKKKTMLLKEQKVMKIEGKIGRKKGTEEVAAAVAEEGEAVLAASVVLVMATAGAQEQISLFAFFFTIVIDL